ncbi:MAG: PAS domain S-box protein [Elusimicrobia bacterium]|nr:PAS domain S-box protein [Elusimicrobiota bacterium]
MKRFQALIENSWDAVMLVGQDGLVLYHTPSIEPILGYKPEEVVGKPIWDFIHGAGSGGGPEAVRELVGKPELGGRRELQLRHKDGSLRTVEIVANDQLANPDVQGIVVNYRDVTARRLAEDHLIESERLYRALVETTNTGYVVVDGEGRVVDANPEYVRLSGHRGLDDIRGRGVMEWTVPSDRERNAAAVADCFKNGFVRNLEIDYADREGRVTPIEINATVVQMGEKPLIMTICRDITSRRRAQEALRRSEAMLAEAERLAGIGSVVRDLRTGEVYRSQGVHRIFGAGKDEMPDQPENFLRYVHEDDRERLRRALQDNDTTSGRLAEEYRIRRPDGAERIIHVEGETSKDEQGRPARFFAWLQDITERRRLEEKILRISDRERRNIGHDLHDDLGQQLTGIALLGRALQERLSDQSSPEAGAMAELLRHVDRALVQVRELARGLQSAPARPEGLLEALAGLAAHVRSTAKVSCRLEADRRVLVREPGVADHLYRIAQEAVHNAVRHGRPREITIDLSEDDRGLKLTITDDGTGMLEAPKKGAGMGLDIMRHRASIIHGTLTISSHVGGGTAVICRVPPAAAPDGGRT